MAYPLVDEIWTYTRFVAESISRVAPVPVIPVPIPVTAPEPGGATVDLGVPDGFRFLFAFDFLSTPARKNPEGVIEAFTRAFGPGEGPQLVIKTLHGDLRPRALDRLRWLAEGRPDVHIVDLSLTNAERDALMAGCDCYVSLHRAEGFGLTLAEAMAIGKPVIATGYSGNLDFMTPMNSYLVEYDMTLVGPEGEHYPAEGTWADPRLDHAAALMRRVVEQPDEARTKGERARSDIAAQLSPAAVGRIIRARLEALAGFGEAP
jgi:glycosyltransferase involved in cell wall biosynthesis